MTAIQRDLIIDGLSPREREVLSYTYNEGLTAAQVAQRLSLSRPEVSRVLANATRNLFSNRTRAAAARRRLERMIDTMLPESVPSPAEAWHAQQSAQAREELLKEFAALTAEQVADQAHSTATNRSALASRWHSEGRVIAVQWHGRTLYPEFQFSDGRPSPIVSRVAATLRDRGLSGWPLALWFATPSGWLHDRRPVDLLDTEPQQVLAAAAEALSVPA
jgi:DNA-binding CsgD family transcriptional regulator